MQYSNQVLDILTEKAAVIQMFVLEEGGKDRKKYLKTIFHN